MIKMKGGKKDQSASRDSIMQMMVFKNQIRYIYYDS